VQGFGFPLANHIPTDKQTSVLAYKGHLDPQKEAGFVLRSFENKIALHAACCIRKSSQYSRIKFIFNFYCVLKGEHS